MGYLPHEIAIVGAGICGLTTALALSRAGHSVTLLERDAPPPSMTGLEDTDRAGASDRVFFDWPRRGAAQFRHPHAFLGLMCNTLADNYPDLLADFLDAGARTFRFAEALPPALQASYRPEPGDERLWMLLCRRATIETTLRNYVERQPGVTLRNQQRIIGFTSDDAATPTITGLQRHGSDPFPADIVVDASGRNSKFPRWLADIGRPVREERDDADIVYYTRHYRLLPGISEPPRDPNAPAAGDLGYMKYGVFPGDHGNFALIICVPNGETELREAIRTGDGFDTVCRTIPGLAPWIGPDCAKATTEPFGIGAIHAVWRHFVEDEQPLARNFFAVGDAAVRTNPLYGRGCSTGTLHAHLLAEVLASTTSPDERALAFSAATEKRLRPIYQASLDEDRRGLRQAAAVARAQPLEKPRTLKAWFGLAFGDALAAAAKNELHVIRGVHHTINLLEPPGAFLQNKAIRRTVFRYMLRGRKRNAKARLQPGLSRKEMLSLIASEAIHAPTEPVDRAASAG